MVMASRLFVARIVCATHGTPQSRVVMAKTRAAMGAVARTMHTVQSCQIGVFPVVAALESNEKVRATGLTKPAHKEAKMASLLC